MLLTMRLRSTGVIHTQSIKDPEEEVHPNMPQDHPARLRAIAEAALMHKHCDHWHIQGTFVPRLKQG